MAVVHVVGAGLAGLAAAVRLAGSGREVRVYEAAQHAGGRCRSFFDPTLGQSIDNGNHLLLSGNTATLAYLRAIGAEGSLIGPDAAVFPFVDLASGARWALRWPAGRVPWWLLRPSRRVPGTRLAEYLATFRLARADPTTTLADALDPEGPLWTRFWDPLATAVLNTPPACASARLLWRVIAETFAAGASTCRPLIARDGLSDTFVAPALRRLEQAGARVCFGMRLRTIREVDGRCTELEFPGLRLSVGAQDRVILALPPSQVEALVPGIRTPQSSHAIVNGHFRLDHKVTLPGGSVLLGVIGGTAQWIFARGNVVSLTVSAADRLVDEPAARIAARLWQDTSKALGLAAMPTPPARIVKEKRATFAQTPAEVARRPGTLTGACNLLLAGDWTDTGLPATVEGAIRSGERAAALAVNAP